MLFVMLHLVRMYGVGVVECWLVSVVCYVALSEDVWSGGS